MGTQIIPIVAASRKHIRFLSSIEISFSTDVSDNAEYPFVNTSEHNISKQNK